MVFCDDNNHPLSWLLKRGFRHCFVCLDNNGLWLMVDGGPGIPNIKYLTENDFDLAQYYRESGYTVIETVQRKKAVTSPLVLRTCVGFIKAVLCITGWAFTPYQLYKQLEK